MAAIFLAEDGTGLNGANAYAIVADVDQYHLNAGNAYWGTLNEATVKQPAIVRASQYIDKRFAPKFRGTRRRRTQGLAWPRLGAYDNDGFYIDAIPQQIFNAVCEYAMRAAYYNVLAPDVPRATPGQDMTQSPAFLPGDVVTGQIRTVIKKIGPIETEKQYLTNAEITERWRAGDSRAPQSSIVTDFFIPEYPEADLWIEALLRSPFTAATLSRGD